MAEGIGARRRATWAVVAIVGLTALLRGPLAFAGLPYIHHSDEPTNVRITQRMATERDANPRFFTYPALMFDVGAVVLAPFVDAGPWDPDEGLVGTQTIGNSRTHRPGLIAALRWAVGVLPGLVAVGAAGATAWLACRRWWAAALAAGLAACSPLDLRYGPSVTPNALSGAASALAVLGAVGVAVGVRPPPAGPARAGAPPPLSPSPPLVARRYLLAGAAVGAAAAAKYNAALSGVALAVAHVTVVGRHLLSRWWMPVLAGLSGLATFLVLNPFALVEGRAFVDGLQFESRHYRRGHPGSDSGSSLSFHVAELWRSFGPALLLAPLAPLARTPAARRAALAVLAFVVAYVGFVSTFEVRFARNLLPVTAPVAAVSALGAAAVVERLTDRFSRREDRVGAASLAGAMAAAVCAAALAWPAVEAGRGLDAGLDDPWARAQAWIAEHVDPGAKVAVEPYGAWVDPRRYRVTAVGGLTFQDADWYRSQGFDLLVAGEAHFGPYLEEPDRYSAGASAYRDLFDATCTRFSAGPDGERVLLLALRPCS